MHTADIAQARSQLDDLLDRVARGETVTITRNGAAVARLVAIDSPEDRARRADAIARLKAFAERHTLGGLDWKELRDEGRM